MGACEQEQRRVPESHQVAHEPLLVGEDEARNHDLELGDHHQQREPGEAQAPDEEGDHEGNGDQGPVHIGAAKARAPEVGGELCSDPGLEKPLDAKE